MGLEFFKNFNFVKRVFEEADDKLKFSISKLILEGPENDLQLTKKYSASNPDSKLFNF